MAGVSTGISLLQIQGQSFTPRTVSYTASTNKNVSMLFSDNFCSRQFATDGTTFTTGQPASQDQDGSWASPTGNSTNPEGFSFRWVYVSGVSPNTTFSSPTSNGTWKSASTGLIYMFDVPSTPGTYTSTFTFQVRDSSLTTVLSTNITLNAIRT